MAPRPRRYRFLQPDEYAVLASAAAYATAALTTTTSDARPGGPSLRVDGGVPAQRPLTAEEQEEIAAQLRAWAGLEGPERQAEARQALEERQAELFAEQQRAAQPGSSAAGSAGGQKAQLFPPDFASHYRTQLRALAEGYYTRLHRDGLAQEHFAPRAAERAAALAGGPSTSGAFSSTLLAQEPGRASVYRRSEDPRTRGVSAPAADLLHQPAPAPPAGQVPNEAALPALGGQDPLQLISAASAAAGTDVHSPAVRDQLLHYAHSLYSTGSTQRPAQAVQANPQQPTTMLHPTLLPLLHTLHKLHPEHLPTLLLLSCAYYTSGDLAASLHYNDRILRIDSSYVESMSNIGTTLRALGRWKEAESWWWRAVRLRPGYWDAYENLLGVLCSPQQPESDAKPEGPAAAAATRGPRFSEALRLCEFVEAHVLTRREDNDDSARTHKVAGGGSHPQCMPAHLPTSHGPRLQNLFYAKGNLKYVVPDLGLVPAAREYQKAVEIVLSPSEQNAHSLRDLVVATCVVAILSRRTTFPGHPPEAVIEEISRAVGMDPTDPVQVQHVASGSYAHLSSRGILGAVRNAGDRVVKTLLRLGGGQLPLLMLVPEVALDLARVIFRETNGMLPAIFASSQAQRHAPAAQHQQALQQASQTTSTIVLTLAKLFQDATANPASSSHGPLTLGGIPPSTSLLLPLYYLALSLHS
jgi:tetratricopeptide (TPR) repeat protein